MNPKKPNSAMRHVAKLRLYRKGRATARIPGIGFGVARYNRVLIRGGRANDLPGVNYSLIRGVYDCPSVFGKKKSRSFYGVSRQEQFVKYIRKRMRKRLLGG
jgi:small subunit ribosomal protein S12